MKHFYFIFTLLMMVVMATTVNAQHYDPDGFLEADLIEPTAGNPFDHFEVSYTINGIQDSIVRTTTANYDSLTLVNVGDSCQAFLTAYSVFGDTSNTISSEMAYYADPSGIGDPSFFWRPDPSPRIQTPGTQSK